MVRNALWANENAPTKRQLDVLDYNSMGKWCFKMMKSRSNIAMSKQKEIKNFLTRAPRLFKAMNWKCSSQRNEIAKSLWTEIFIDERPLLSLNDLLVCLSSCFGRKALTISRCSFHSFDLQSSYFVEKPHERREQRKKQKEKINSAMFTEGINSDTQSTMKKFRIAHEMTTNSVLFSSSWLNPLFATASQCGSQTRRLFRLSPLFARSPSQSNYVLARLQ